MVWLMVAKYAISAHSPLNLKNIGRPISVNAGAANIAKHPLLELRNIQKAIIQPTASETSFNGITRISLFRPFAQRPEHLFDPSSKTE